MKRIRYLLIIFLLTPFWCYSQNIVFSDISQPGQSSQGVIVGHVLAENIVGPYYVSFFGEKLDLKKEASSQSNFINESSGNSDNDILLVSYSGKIYSPDIIEPIIFNNKSSVELKMLNFLILPRIFAKPYNLYVDLVLQISSKPISSDYSDDAGNYKGNLNIKLSKNIE